jgi:predicted RNA binding protein YcfA (HicA-like mRNA interferase family)
MSYIKAKGVDPSMMDTNKKNNYSKSSEFKLFKMKHRIRKETSGMGERGDDWNEEKKMKEEVEQIDEMPGANMDTRAVHQHLKKQGWKLSRSTGSHDVFTHNDAKHHIPVPRHRQLKAPLVKSILSQSRMREEVEQIDELKKMPDNMDYDDHITREDLRKWFSKTDPEGDWKRINSKGEVAGPCAREPGEPKPKCMSKEKRSQLSKSERAAAVATKRKHDPNPERKGKPINVSNYGKGKLSEDSVDEACWDTHKQVGLKKKGGKMVPDCVPKNEEVHQIDEKNKPTNPKLWSRAVSMARSKFSVYPSAYANGWASKWYKSKGGGWKSVKEEALDEQGLGNKETSPMAATDSVKAMESTHRKRQMKSARIIKSIYKKKMRETMYDWEKDDKGGKTPNAKIVLQGGKTMTGQDRDTVEIDPVLRTRPNTGKPTV